MGIIDGYSFEQCSVWILDSVFWGEGGTTYPGEGEFDAF